MADEEANVEQENEEVSLEPCNYQSKNLVSPVRIRMDMSFAKQCLSPCLAYTVMSIALPLMLPCLAAALGLHRGC